MGTAVDAVRNAACDAVVDLLDDGQVLFENAASTALANCVFGSPAFGAASGGTATANAVTDDTAAVAGTVDRVVLRNSASTDQITGCTVSEGAGLDFNLSSTVFGSGDTVSVTGITITMPAT